MVGGVETEGDLFGGVAEAFRLQNAQKLLIRGLERSCLAVTEIRNDRSDFGLTDPMPLTDSYMLGVQLRALPHHELWFDDRPMDVRDVAAGDSIFYDLRRGPRANVVDPSHSIHFILRRDLIGEVADELGVDSLDELKVSCGVPVRDKVLTRLGRMMVAALGAPRELSQLHASHLMISLVGYLASTYASVPKPLSNSVDLSPVDARLAKEWIRANLDGGVDLRELADICRQPTLRFAAAFRSSTGMAPYQWMATQRLETAKSLLQNSDRPVAEIARACGFADDRHFRKVFTKATGASPTTYRREVRAAKHGH